MEERIIDILVSFLGEYSKQCGEWYSFNCPRCAEEEMGRPDDKYNLEVNVDLSSNGCGGFHCWKCGDSDNMHGTLFRLFREYAPQSALDELNQIVKEYRESAKYELFGNDDTILTPQTLYLPDEFRPIKGNEKDAKEAIEYLNGRGISEKVMYDFNMGFIGSNAKERSLRNRVFIPSYDMFDTLTYWVGRDYTGENKQKVKNPKTSKSEIVFNEGRINWYEPITIVEGPFDHIAVPNSIPLLGKTLTKDYSVFNALKKRSRNDINIFLDDDAQKDAYRIYKVLNNDEVLRGRINVIDTPEGYDPALLYQEYGYKGVLEVMCSAHTLDEYDVNNIR